MRVSGKFIVFLMFAMAIALGWWVRIKATRINPQSPNTEQLTTKPTKKIKGYRSKMFPSMEQARSHAEKKLNQLYPEKMMITKYESRGDGWLFYYETEKYLNSGKKEDQSSNTAPIYVRKDGTAELYSPEEERKHY
jgi:cytoskeletal protein RodZ